MISSMTGMGIGEVHCDSGTVVVEIKSVNNRYLEVSCRMPSFLIKYERNVKEIIRKNIHRGKVYVTISIQGESDDSLEIRVDDKTVLAVKNLLESLRRETGLKEKLRLDHFLKFSDIFQNSKESDGANNKWKDVEVAVKYALNDLKKMRKEEGKALVRDITQRIKKLENNIKIIEKIDKKNVIQTHNKMVKRVHQLVKENDIDENRLYSEIAILADKMDITEECVRLRSHNQTFSSIIENDCVVGKKLNFLLQEMNRETNTISSKASNAKISYNVVGMKEEIEKLREQVQNLE
jgi:uncharacterized protein (TIGR00255 family)